MFSRLFWTVLFVCLALHAVLAQDPTKVEPQHYKLAFENEWVQVVDVHYGPHERSGLHDHPGGVVVVLTAGHLRFTDENGKVKEVFAKPGESRWYPAFKHKVENLGDTAYNAVYIGLKTKTLAGKAIPPDGQPAMHQQTLDAQKMDEQTAKILAKYALASANK
jgi:quercetin dioxygenase-like cupin family protein